MPDFSSFIHHSCRHSMAVLLLWAVVPATMAQAQMPGNDSTWKELAQKPVHVECTEFNGKPWCRSRGLVMAPMAAVSEALKQMRHNAEMFESVISVDIVSSDVLHVVLDYPPPLDDRDYVAKYTFTDAGDTHTYSWIPAPEAKVPNVDGVVRLPNYAGEWRLESQGEATWVRYTWQAEINGSFPSFGYSTAWKKAGHEALKDLANTQKAELRTE